MVNKFHFKIDVRILVLRRKAEKMMRCRALTFSPEFRIIIQETKELEKLDKLQRMIFSYAAYNWEEKKRCQQAQ